MKAVLAALVMTACGRISFDPVDPRTDAGATNADADTSLPLCLSDDFDDGDITDWQHDGEWAVALGSGPDGSPTLSSGTDTTLLGVTHPSLRGVTKARVELDIRISAPSNGDFYLHFLEPGWTNPAGDTKYRVAVYPVGSDNSLDNIRRVIRPVNTTLAETPTVVAANTWHHIEVTLGTDHAVGIAIDSTPHLTSPSDSVLAGPFDIVFDFYKPGDIDNVRVSCLR